MNAATINFLHGPAFSPITKQGAFFLSYEPRFMYAGDIDKAFWERARVGFAPYLANYNDLNTWLMVQIDHHPTKDDALVAFTPLGMRCFTPPKTTLMEAGYSSNHHLMFNWQLQF